MEVTSVTSKGLVTIPKGIRQWLGIRQGTRLAFVLVGDHVEIRISPPTAAGEKGFGMLKSSRSAMSADLDPAALLKR